MPRSPLNSVQMPAKANRGRSSLRANQTTSFFLVSGVGSSAYSAKLIGPAPDPVSRRTVLSSDPHEAFALAFRPGERLFHRFALIVTQAHFRQRGLYVDLLRNLWRRRRGRNRQLLMVMGVGVVIERALRRPLFLPNLQRGQLLVCRQVVTAAGDHQFLDR